MMISKVQKNTSGNLVVSVVILLLAVAGGFTLLAMSRLHLAGATRNSAQTIAMMDAHSIASLLKADLLENYEKYKTDRNWASCRASTPSPQDFLKILDTQNCAHVSLIFSHFQTNESRPRHYLRVQELKRTSLVPLSETNQYTHEIKNISFNLEPTRNQLLADLSQMSSTGLHKRQKMIIDIARTVALPPRSLKGKICRTIAGSVCDESLMVFTLNYLESGGRIMEASHDPVSGNTIISSTSFPRAHTAISVKNLATTFSNYRLDSFCLPAVQRPPVKWIVDVARKSSGENYFLTAHGRLLRSNGTDAWAVADPRWISIAYFDFQWWLLRSDGHVFRGPSVGTPSLLLPTGLVLPTSEKIVSGEGPRPCP